MWIVLSVCVLMGLTKTKGSPSNCGKTLKPSYEVSANSNLDLSVGLCDNPKPTVYWLFNGRNLKGNYANGPSLNQFVYSVTLEKVKPAQCGRIMKVTALGNETYLIFNITIYVIATPVDPVISQMYFNKGCIDVTWNLFNAGLCPVIYEVNFLEADGTVSYSVNVTKLYAEEEKEGRLQYCTGVEGVTTTNIRALFGVNTAQYSVTAVSESTPAPCNTTTGPTHATKKCSDTNNTGAIAGGTAAAIIYIVVSAIVFFMLGRRSITSKLRNTEEVCYNTSGDEVNVATSQESNYTEINSAAVKRNPYTDLNRIPSIPKDYENVYNQNYS